jgi:hypothetical protein
MLNRAKAYMTDSEFFQEIKSQGYIWVAMEKNTALMFSNDEGGLSIPIWTEQTNANEYLKNINSSCRPIQVPVEVFKSAWISNIDLNIKEIIVSPSGLKNTELALNVSEFINGIWQ